VVRDVTYVYIRTWLVQTYRNTIIKQIMLRPIEIDVA